MSQTSSLQKCDTIITVASWEERFLKGIQSLIEVVKPSKIIMFYFAEFAKWSQSNRDSLASLCSEKNITLPDNLSPLSFSFPKETWNELRKQIDPSVKPNALITLDISTMPRVTIWSICHVLELKKATIQYVYNKPGKYGDWLSRDPGRPRLLYKLAGIQHLGRPTALIVQTGYDVERTKQLVRFYEPQKLVLALQTGGQFSNPALNRDKHRDAFDKHRGVEMHDVDGYSFLQMRDKLMEITKPFLNKYNVILSSLGPKIGALSAFAVKRSLPDVAMSYAPSNDFNLEYSSGIGECIHGTLESVSEK
jgi:hypothetical protein